MVPFEQRAEAFELVNAYGLPLDMYIKLINEEPPDEWATGNYKDDEDTEVMLEFLEDA